MPINRGGKVLASFFEIFIATKDATERIIAKLAVSNLCHTTIIGKLGAAVCEMPVRSNHVGMLLLSGLNPTAAVAEAGIEIITMTMRGVVDVTMLQSYWS